MKKNIFIALSTFAKFDKKPLTLLKRTGFSVTCNPTGRRLKEEEIIQFGKNVDGILAGVEPYSADVLENLPNLRCISRCGVGTDAIDMDAAKKKGVTVCITPHSVIVPVVELTIAMMFDLVRKLSWHTALLKSGRWEKKAGTLLAGKRVGIVGIGRIGKKVSETLQKLGAEVYATDQNPDRTWAERKKIKLVSLQKLLCECDIVSLHCAFDKKAPLRLGKKEFDMMKKGAFLVNTARGAFIDEEALYQALKNQTLGGAALDVFSEEPYHGKLCELENVVLTPHIATLTIESRAAMEIEAANNLISFFQRKPLRKRT